MLKTTKLRLIILESLVKDIFEKDQSNAEIRWNEIIVSKRRNEISLQQKPTQFDQHNTVIESKTKHILLSNAFFFLALFVFTSEPNLNIFNYLEELLQLIFKIIVVPRDKNTLFNLSWRSYQWFRYQILKMIICYHNTCTVFIACLFGNSCSFLVWKCKIF